MEFMMECVAKGWLHGSWRANDLPCIKDSQMIKLYCVGIYFLKDIAFVADIPSTSSTPAYMYGSTILAAAAALGLRYQVNAGGHLEYVSYTPVVGDTFRHFKPSPAVPPGPGAVAPFAFPFYGQPLSHFESPKPIGQPSQILQYTSAPRAKTDLVDNPQFYFNGFQDGSDIRIRLESIYVSQAPTY